MVILVVPVLDNDPGLGQCPELFPVETLLPEAFIEALDKAVLQKTTWIDVEGQDASHSLRWRWISLEPLSLRICSGDSIFLDPADHDPPDLACIDLPIHMDAPALSDVLVQDREHA